MGQESVVRCSDGSGVCGRRQPMMGALWLPWSRFGSLTTFILMIAGHINRLINRKKIKINKKKIRYILTFRSGKRLRSLACAVVWWQGAATGVLLACRYYARGGSQATVWMLSKFTASWGGAGRARVTVSLTLNIETAATNRKGQTKKKKRDSFKKNCKRRHSSLRAINITVSQKTNLLKQY